MSARPLVALVAALSLAAFADVAIPPVARVTDLTGTLDASQRTALDQRLAAFEEKKGSQVAVLIVTTTEPETIEQYSLRVAEAWKLGRKKVDDGALLVVAKDDRKLRIEVGYGLEGAVPDAIAKRIIEEIITPRFREGDFYGGISAGVDQLLHVIDGEPLPEPPKRARNGSGGPPDSLIIVGFVLFALSRVFSSLLGRFPTALVSGGLAGAVAAFVIGSVVAGIIAGVIMFFVALMSSFMPVGRGGWTSGGGSSWGGGGGGFSGGGGSFGGGGASGSW